MILMGPRRRKKNRITSLDEVSQAGKERARAPTRLGASFLGFNYVGMSSPQVSRPRLVGCSSIE